MMIDGEIHFLELAVGEVTKVAGSAAEFQRLTANKNNQSKWFMLGLLTELERAGMTLENGS